MEESTSVPPAKSNTSPENHIPDSGKIIAKSRRKFLLFSGIIILCAVILTGIVLKATLHTDTQNRSESVTETAKIPTATPIIIENENLGIKWKDYGGENAGFSFRIPETWTEVESYKRPGENYNTIFIPPTSPDENPGDSRFVFSNYTCNAKAGECQKKINDALDKSTYKRQFTDLEIKKTFINGKTFVQRTFTDPIGINGRPAKRKDSMITLGDQIYYFYSFNNSTRKVHDQILASVTFYEK